MTLIRLDGTNIIIFGGTGSIGTVFTEVLLSNVKYPNIYLVTNNEQEIWEAQQKWKNYKPIHIIFGDIRDREEIRKLFINIKPHMIINCAALKHVNYCEEYVMNTIKTNILGLENLLYLSNEYGVKEFLQVSTDKAVEPISVMGASKMLGEKLCREWNKIIHGISLIRLGNVIDSRGSLLPTLRKQLEKGDTVYYTDEKMYRYCITLEELWKFLEVVLKDMMEGWIYIPKIKEINIFEFIRDFIQTRKKPHRYIKLERIGRRKGEKYREKLFSEYEEIKEFKKYYKIKMED